MPRQHYSTKSLNKETPVSCCKIEDFAKSCCSNSSHENNKLESDCTVNCCCFEFNLSSEDYPNFLVVVFENIAEEIDIYSNKYNYSFNYTIHKPPIYFIS